jgi:predicted transcriptional regulator
MKRSRYELLRCILETCIEPSTKTRIVYQVNLNFHTILSIFGFIDKGRSYTSLRTNPISYHTTPKGLEVLEHLKAIKLLIADLN